MQEGGIVAVKRIAIPIGVGIYKCPRQGPKCASFQERRRLGCPVRREAQILPDAKRVVTRHMVRRERVGIIDDQVQFVVSRRIVFVSQGISICRLTPGFGDCSLRVFHFGGELVNELFGSRSSR